ncbi:F-box protein [Candidatus Odyssella acanthamoebae]|uniref:F-box domain-containing protein n=1 Tax=Candidatus Odyssella acanthamoebae TaxID=91604 RepID=A0A077B2H8_9PROT|nr:F-box protein [Candidatus Paracaedibacter acanthamoebae]AIK97205.1 hypothetical protein ID47_11395 [Candidatus Paracaedibacter acanthamoebae]
MDLYNKFNKIKTILLLSALFFYGQNNVWAQDNSLAAEKELPQVGCKRTADQVYLGAQEESYLQDEPSVKKQCINKDATSSKTSQENPVVSMQTEDDYFGPLRLGLLPNEILEEILNLFNIKEKGDRNALLSISAVCKGLRDIVLSIYNKGNKAEHHYPWQDHQTLSPITLYIANSNLRTLLGLYVNIKENWAQEADRIRFARLCAQFGKGPLAFASKYIEFLHFNLNCDAPTLLQRPLLNLRNQLPIKMQSLEEELAKIVDRQDPNSQNEIALYFHYIQFISDTDPATLTSLKSQPIFPQENSFMAVMSPELLTLKATDGLSEAPDFAGIWREIIDLEPAVTLWQLKKAGYSNYGAGKFSESSRFMGKFLTIMQMLGKRPTVGDYGNTASAHFRAGNYAKAAEYREEHLEAITQSGQIPTVKDYGNAASAYFSSGNYAKAAEYREKHLEAITQSGQIPTVKDYGNAASAYFLSGNYAKAAEYREKKLEVISQSGQIPTANDYGKAASAFSKIKNYAKAAEYLEKKLEVISQSGQIPTANDYGKAASAFSKIKNYAKAAEYLEKKLEAIIQSGERPTARNYKKAADDYFDTENYEQAAKYYGNAADAYRGVGYYALRNTGNSLPAYAKAAGCSEMKLEAISQSGKIPTAEDYKDAAEHYYMAAEAYFGTGNYAKAEEYYEKQFKAISQSGESPTIVEYRNMAFTYFMTGNLLKATEHDEKRLELKEAVGQNQQNSAEEPLEPHKSKRKLAKETYSYNINNLRSFLTYLLNKGYTCTDISGKIHGTATDEELRKIRRGRIKRPKNGEAVWNSLKENFPLEAFKVWSKYERGSE